MDDEGIIGATIYLISSDTTLQSGTDIDGNFAFNNLRPQSYRLRFSYIGYEPREMQLGKVENDTIVNWMIHGDGSDVSTDAELDIANGNPLLYVFGGPALRAYTNDDKEFEESYGVTYYLMGCVLEKPMDYMIAYNTRVLDWLGKKYGTAWLPKIRDDVAGLDLYKPRAGSD